MNARRKLNVAYFTGTVLVAAAAGIVCQSWLVFVVILVSLVLLGLYLGDIRPSSHA